MLPILDPKRPLEWLCDIRVLILAYELVKNNSGNTDPRFKKSMDGISLKELLDISSLLKKGKYRFSPSVRVEIPKGEGKGTRPIDMTPPRDKIVQIAMVIMLNIIFHGHFDHRVSHGFHLGKGVHTCLALIKKDFVDCH